MKDYLSKVAVFVGCVLLVAGCGDKQGSRSGRSPQKATTPRQALENMQIALLDGDKEALVSCFEASAKQEEMLGAFSEFTIVANQFERAMIKAYGEEAVKEAMGGRKQGMKLDDENWLDEVNINVEGDRAIVMEKDGGKMMQLVKKDGLWKIDAASMMGMEKGGSDKDIEQAKKMFEAMTGAVNEVKPKIGQEGYTAKKVNDELSQAMMMAMMKQSGLKLPSVPRE